MRDANDKYFKAAKFQVNEVADAAMPGRFLVDILPICWVNSDIDRKWRWTHTMPVKYVPEWMPGAYFQRKARICRESMHEFVDDPYNSVKAKMVRRTYMHYCPHINYTHVAWREGSPIDSFEQTKRAGRWDHPRRRQVDHERCCGLLRWRALFNYPHPFALLIISNSAGADTVRLNIVRASKYPYKSS